MAHTKEHSKFPTPKYSKKMTEFICDKIEEGLTLAEVCDKYAPDHVPIEKTMYRWKKKYPEFKAAIRESYKVLLVRLIDKKLKLANRAAILADEINKTENTYTQGEFRTTSDHAIEDSIKKAKFELDAIKIQQKALEFTLTRIAPLFVDDLKHVNSSENAITSLPPITIVNYIDGPDSKLKVIDQVNQLELTHEVKSP